jgi:hypothetical protein
MAKDTLRGPAQTVWSGAVTRTFPIFGETTKLEFRAEYFNLLNHTNLNNPSVSNPIGSSTTFGTITGSGDPRIAQFALKLLF